MSTRFQTAFQGGYAQAVEDCAQIAERWRDENRVARDKARTSGRRRHAFDGDETQLVMADQLDGAMIECNAIAGEIRKLRLAPGMEAATAGETTEIGSTEGDSPVAVEDGQTPKPCPVCDMPFPSHSFNCSLDAPKGSRP